MRGAFTSEQRDLTHHAAGVHLAQGHIAFVTRHSCGDGALHDDADLAALLPGGDYAVAGRVGFDAPE